MSKHGLNSEKFELQVWILSDGVVWFFTRLDEFSAPLHVLDFKVLFWGAQMMQREYIKSINTVISQPSVHFTTNLLSQSHFRVAGSEEIQVLSEIFKTSVKEMNSHFQTKSQLYPEYRTLSCCQFSLMSRIRFSLVLWFGCFYCNKTESRKIWNWRIICCVRTCFGFVFVERNGDFSHSLQYSQCCSFQLCFKV